MPNHKNPWSEPPDHGIGRSRGGLTTKLHLVCDGRGRPLSMMITAGNINDTTMMSAVLEDIRVPRDGKGRPRTRPDRVLADKGYPSRANRAWLRDRRIAATIPERDDQIAHRRRKPGRPIDFMLVDIWTPMALPALRLVTPHLRPGALVVCDNVVGAASEYRDYLGFVRDPDGPFTSVTVPGNGGMEISRKR